ncbi:LysR family transcriptional regulator [Nonomuraea sp. NPDC049158]|uniref:LysR family transcriptional regulator n=1 Tax=Nonomuraea sp. NPDC049158 TaxID=3155649 RepID=UPI0033E0E4B7
MERGAADLDLGTVRAFVAVTEERYFSEAAARLGISQQAVSKRIAKLESDLGARLFARSRSGTDLTEDGRAFLHHARALVSIADQALEVLRGRRRALRADVLDTRLASIDLIRAAFARVGGALEEDLRHVPAYLEPVHLLVSRDHPLADLRKVEMERLSGSTVWMPGNHPESEWAEFYRSLSAAFDIRIDTSGPNFGWDYFVEEIGSGERIGFVGERCRLPWHPRTVQIPIADPAPLYPWSLLFHPRNQHPVLARLIRFVARDLRPFDPRHQWLPDLDRAAFSG